MTIKLLWSSDSPLVPTGFGVQSYNFCKLLGKNPELDIKFMAWQYFGHRLNNYEGAFDILPCSHKSYGQSMYDKYYELEKPDVLITLGDAWMVAPVPNIHRAAQWLAYYPVDGDPLSKHVYDIVSKADERIAMSYFGKHVTEMTGLDAHYVPHGFDPKIFKPLPKKQKRALKKAIGWEDRFIYGVVSRPNPRKHLERMFQAYGQMLKEVPEAREKTGMYLHMDLTDPMTPSNFQELLNIYGIEQNVKITNHPYLAGLTPQELNEVYNMFDIQCIPTGGEGFGVTQIEAGGAGIPTMMTNYTTPPEVLRGGTCGMLIPTEKLIMEVSGVRKGWVKIDEFKRGMKYVFEHPDILKKYRANLKEVMPYYHFKNVVPRMEELIFASVGNVKLKEFKLKETKHVDTK